MKKTPSRHYSLSALTLLLATWFTACQSLPTRTVPDSGRLQGYWQGDGPGGECSVTISGNTLHYSQREDFWFETTFTLPAGTDPEQLHATIIKESSPQGANIGTVVVTLFKLEDTTLTLGVVEDFKGPPESPVIGDWERVMDIYYLKRAEAD